MPCYRQLSGGNILTDVQGLDTGRVHDVLIQLQVKAAHPRRRGLVFEITQ